MFALYNALLHLYTLFIFIIPIEVSNGYYILMSHYLNNTSIKCYKVKNLYFRELVVDNVDHLYMVNC